MANRQLLSVVDDDESLRGSLSALLRLIGYDVAIFASAEAFLASGDIDATDCLMLDVAMPGMSGPDLQRELKRRRQAIPIIFITAQRDATIRHRLLAGGAVECLFKPFSEQALLDAIDHALRRSQP